MPEINQHHSYRKIENLKLYYNFYNKNSKLYSIILSGRQNTEEILFKDYSKILIEDETEHLIEKPIEPLKYNLKNLKKK